MALNCFFQPGAAKDPIYLRVRDKNVAHEAKGRDFIENIWTETNQFLDSNLAERASKNENGLVSAFAEMYFAYALKANGIKLVPRNGRTPPKEGPDLFAEAPDVWTEVVAATRGTRLGSPDWGRKRVRDDDYILRLTTAIDSKARQLQDHLNKGYLRVGQAVVIGVSGAMLPFCGSEFIVRAVLGVGNRVLELDPQTLNPMGQGVEYRDEVRNPKGAPVKTDAFLNQHSHVSAVIYTGACWDPLPQMLGAEFVVVHNRQATHPLPHGWFPLGDEYWLDGSVLCHARRTAPRSFQ
jgi:hypothetical protein